MCDYIEKIIVAALNGAIDEKEIIISDMKSDITDLENSDQEDKDSLLEVLKGELSIVEAINIEQIGNSVEIIHNRLN